MFLRDVNGLTQSEAWIAETRCVKRRDGCRVLAVMKSAKLLDGRLDWIAGIGSVRRLLALGGYKYSATPIVTGFARLYCPR